LHKRPILPRIWSAVAVQRNGRERALQLATNASMRRTSSPVLANEPRRISRRVMIPNQRSTWFSYEA